MTCPENRNNISEKPDPTDTMKRKNQVYVWGMIKNNPNLYCWIPKSNKNIETESIPLEQVKVLDIPPPVTSNIAIENVEKIAEKIRNRYMRKKLNDKIDVVSYDDPKKYKIVKKFIRDKGLIIYGGLAINASLPKNEKIYKPNAIPDYDVFSTDPWNDSVELANKLYEAGYEYSEVRGGIHKGTYKVFANMWPVADITYLPPEDFEKLQTKKRAGLKMIGDAKIMSDIFRQLTSVNDIYRWDKTYKRQKLYQKWNQPLGKKYKCNKDIFLGGKVKIPEQFLELLEIVRKFIQDKKLIQTGPVAYNTYIQYGGGDQRILIDHYETLSENAQTDIMKLAEILIRSSKNISFDLQKLDIDIRHQTGKSDNNFSYIINYEGKPLCIITQLTICIGYKYINGYYIAGVDFIKWLLYTDLAYSSKKEGNNIKCKIKYLTEIQNNYYKKKKITDLDDSPFQRLIASCRGPLEEGIKTVLLKRWIDRIEERNTIKVIKPRKNTITLKNVEGVTIRIFPKSQNDVCEDNKTKEYCNYPCNWNTDQQKCFPVPTGIYRVEDANIEILKELPISDNDDMYPIYDIYPSYG